jgi:hypothetical protein
MLPFYHRSIFLYSALGQDAGLSNSKKLSNEAKGKKRSAQGDKKEEISR